MAMQVFDLVTPVPALLLCFAAKWDMPQLRSFCEGLVSLWEVHTAPPEHDSHARHCKDRDPQGGPRLRS
jgi:hypothetical protein